MKIYLIPPIIKEYFERLITPLIRVLVKYRLNPNWLTTASFIISIGTAVLFANGKIRIAAVVLLLGSILDRVDGRVARESNRVTHFGAFYDSVIDRYTEIVNFLGIGYYFIEKSGSDFKLGLLISLLVFLALAGSLMVSYIRARAEALHFECNVGVMQRPERVVILGFGALISEQGLVVALILIVFFTHLTMAQRIYHVWREATSQNQN